MGKVIKMDLTVSSIDNAIRELKAFSQSISDKEDLFRQRVARRLRELVQEGFDSAQVEDLLSGGSRKPDVTVTAVESENITLVVASGTDAVYVEFGAGVYHNGAPGTSPHPKGGELGFTIGDYGFGMGKRNVWGFYDGAEILQLTRGTPATMPMYEAAKRIREELPEIAKEVFGD